MRYQRPEKAAKSGSLDRREFIKRAGALGLAAPFATSMLTQAVQAAVPEGGKFIMGVATDPPLIRWIPNARKWLHEQCSQYLCQSPVLRAARRHPQPELAESFEPSDGARLNINSRKVSPSIILKSSPSTTLSRPSLITLAKIPSQRPKVCSNWSI